MTRFHMHLVVESLPKAIKFYSKLFNALPCCRGRTYANWRIDEPPVNLATSVMDRPTGLAHFGLEVERGEELLPIDRVLRGSLRKASVVPWEVSVRNQRVETGV